MRRPVTTIALVASVSAASLLLAVRLSTPDPKQFLQSASTDLAIAFIEVAVTVGIVDLLLQTHTERHNRRSIAPRVHEFIEHLRFAEAAREQRLSTSSLGDLEQYRRVVADLQEAAFGLSILLSTVDSQLASPLLKFSRDLREQLELIQDAMAALQNASTDSGKRIARADTNGRTVYESGGRLTDDLAIAFPAHRISLLS